MTDIPEAAIEAAAEAAKLSHYDARLAVEAAMPAIRESLSHEIAAIYAEHGHADDWGVRVMYLSMLQERIIQGGAE